MEPQETQHPSADQESMKKVYTKPHLQLYGNLAEITWGVRTGSGRIDSRGGTYNTHS